MHIYGKIVALLDRVDNNWEHLFVKTLIMMTLSSLTATLLPKSIDDLTIVSCGALFAKHIVSAIAIDCQAGLSLTRTCLASTLLSTLKSALKPFYAVFVSPDLSIFL